MAIYNPEVYLSTTDKELLGLLASLLSCHSGNKDSNNASPDSILLSDSEASRLFELLEEFVESKKFREGAYFVDCLVGPEQNERAAKEIYLSWRWRYGRSRAVSTVQWQNFLARLGLWLTHDGGSPAWYRPGARPMDFKHFLEMERRLANAARLNPRVRELVIKFVEAREASLQSLRRREATLEAGASLKPPKWLLDQLRPQTIRKVGPAPMSSARIGAVMTIVLDTSTLFTTRDWSVTGFLSTIAGSIPPALSDK